MKSTSIVLNNIIPNSSFELDTDWIGVNYSTEQYLFGTRSSELSGSTITQSINVPSPIVGHKYYGRTYIISNGEIGASDNRFELFGGDGEGLNWVFARNDGNFPNWTMLSSIVNINSVNAQSYSIRNFVVSAQNPCWTDGLMIIDLTASFGAGNEPTKEWMDLNIPYFNGSYTYEYNQNMFVKVDGAWWPVTGIYTKTNNTW